MCGGSNTLVIALHVPTISQLKNHYFKGKLCYYPQPNLHFTTKSKVNDPNTPNSMN
jgi:hypothetical protein